MTAIVSFNGSNVTYRLFDSAELAHRYEAILGTTPNVRVNNVMSGDATHDSEFVNQLIAGPDFVP